MDVVDPQPHAAKRGRRNQDTQSASPPTAVAGNGDGAQGRVPLPPLLRLLVNVVDGGHLS